MGVTQYIGARYVPIFADPAEWTSTRTYEPLTIVMHEGNSFTSKQFVPVGIDINNDAFWAETGNYNAQVEAYRQEVLGYRDDIKEKAFAFDTVADMKASELLYNGAICHTSGFHTSSDGGAAWYEIKNIGVNSTDIAYDKDIIPCYGGLFAHLIIINDEIALEQLGIKIGDFANDYFDRAYTLTRNIIVLKYGYKLNSPIRIKHDSSLTCKTNLSYLKENVDNNYHFNWYGPESDSDNIYPMFTTVSGENITSYIYDDYPKSGIKINNLRVNGKNKAAIGILICAQRNTNLDGLAAVNCTIGICVTRSWGIVIGTIETWFNKLGFSTIPAYDLRSDGTPVIPNEVIDAAVNNITINNINSAINDNGAFFGVMLQSCINSINSEELTGNGKYHIYCSNCGSHFGNVHIENLDDSYNLDDDTFNDIVVNSTRYIVPSFGCVQCNSIKSNASFNIDTLYAYYRGGTSEIPLLVKFLTTDNADNKKPFVNIFSGWDYVNYNDRKYMPQLNNPDINTFVNGDFSINTCGNNILQIVIDNNSNNDYEDGGTITFNNSHGGSTLVNIPKINAKSRYFTQVTVPYSTTSFGKINVNISEITNGIIDIAIGNNLVAKRVYLRQRRA